MKINSNIEENSIPEVIGIKDILDIIGVMNLSINTLAENIKIIKKFQDIQDEKINTIMEYIQNNKEKING